MPNLPKDDSTKSNKALESQHSNTSLDQKKPGMIDIGINLASESFDLDREEVFQRGLDSNVIFSIITGSCPHSNAFASEFAQHHIEHARSTAGIHPHHADKTTQEHLASVQKLLKEPHVVAVGETGLDFFRNISCPKKQEEIFEAHLQFAVETQLPLFLHQRDSHKRFFPLIKEYRDHISSAVVHCFTDNKKALFDYLDMDLHIGITGWVCDERRGVHLWELVPNIPNDRLMIETDSPYLLPRTIRPKPKSRRNESAYLVYVAQKIAELKKTGLQNVIDQTRITAQHFFKLPQF